MNGQSNNLVNNKLKFVLNEIKMNSWAASVQHNKVYIESASQKERRDFRLSITGFIDGLVFPYYKEEIDENLHIKNLVNIQNEANVNFSTILNDGVHRLGTIQKYFNLYLKYLWCLNKIYTPPHCPVDKIILMEAGNRSTAWTKMETIDEYKTAIEEIKGKANGIPLAEWELDVWQRRIIKS